MERHTEINPQGQKPESRPLAFIFDIDGVLADNAWRQGLLTQEGKLKKTCWEEFCQASAKDPVFQDTFLVLKALQAQGYLILLVTGRSEVYNHITLPWLENLGIYPDGYYARPRTNFKKDWEFKQSVYKTHIEPSYRILGVFEDRTDCVKMWRSWGLTCYQPREETYSR